MLFHKVKEGVFVDYIRQFIYLIFLFYFQKEMSYRQLYSNRQECCDYHSVLSRLDRCLFHFKDSKGVKDSICPELSR